MSIVKFGFFSDEVSDDFDRQLQALAENDITSIELRSVWGKNVMKLSPRKLKQVVESAVLGQFFLTSQAEKANLLSLPKSGDMFLQSNGQKVPAGRHSAPGKQISVS